MISNKVPNTRALSVVPARSCVAKSAAGVRRSTAPRLRTLEDLPVEDGAALLGMATTVLEGDFKPEPYFRKLDTDAFMMSFGVVAPPKLTIKDPALVRDTLMKGDLFVMDQPDSVSRLVFAEGSPLEGEQSKKWRAAVGKVLAPEAVMRLQLPLIIEYFQETIRGHVASGEVTKWRSDSRKMAFSIACRAVLGDALPREDIDYLFPRAMGMFDGIFAMDFGFEKGLPFTQYRKGYNGRQEMIELMSARMEVLLRDRDSLDKDIILVKLLDALEEQGLDTSPSKSKEVALRMAKEVVFMMMAGTDTTQFQLAKAAQYLARYPEWLKALNEEQDRLRTEIGDDFGRKVISRSAVAQAVAQEILRVAPTLQLLYRKATADAVIGDIEVPEGTSVALAISPPTRLTGNANPEFDPAQWLNEDWTKCTQNTESGNMAFGAGPHRCPGQSLATMEAIVSLAIFGREVGGINMSEEEMYRDWTFWHPTGMPCSFVGRA